MVIGGFTVEFVLIPLLGDQFRSAFYPNVQSAAHHALLRVIDQSRSVHAEADFVVFPGHVVFAAGHKGGLYHGFVGLSFAFYDGIGAGIAGFDRGLKQEFGRRGAEDELTGDFLSLSVKDHVAAACVFFGVQQVFDVIQPDFYAFAVSVQTGGIVHLYDQSVFLATRAEQQGNEGDKKRCFFHNTKC